MENPDEEKKDTVIDIPRVWVCNGSKVDKGLVTYLGTIGMSTIVVVFAITQLIRGESEGIYLPLLSLVVGLHLPQPKSK